MKVVDRSFLGHFETVLYLEDCGILTKLLTGDLCAHYRQFESLPFYRWCRPLEDLDTKVDLCSVCHLQTSTLDLYNRFVVVGNFLAGKCPRTHNLCTYLERSRIPYTSLDTCNIHIEGEKRMLVARAFMKKNGIKEGQPIHMPRYWIFDTEIVAKDLQMFASQGLIKPVLRGQRCVKCL